MYPVVGRPAESITIGFAFSFPAVRPMTVKVSCRVVVPAAYVLSKQPLHTAPALVRNCWRTQGIGVPCAIPGAGKAQSSPIRNPAYRRPRLTIRLPYKTQGARGCPHAPRVDVLVSAPVGRCRLFYAT